MNGYPRFGWVDILRFQHSKSIPFPIQAKNEEDEVTAKAKAAFQYMCDTAREKNIDMSLDEINEEIREVRRLRKERNNGICGD